MILNTHLSGGVNTKDANATSADILTGKTAYVGKEKVEGEMPNNGDVNTAIENGVLKAGYTSGGQIQNLIEGNIVKGVVIAGVKGSAECGYTGTFTLTNYTNGAKIKNVWIDGVNVTGTATAPTVTTYPFKNAKSIVVYGSSINTASASSGCSVVIGNHSNFTVVKITSTAPKITVSK